MPRNYAGEVWPCYYSFLGQSRDSDALERANFDAGWEAVKATNPEHAQIVREHHWAVGWVEWIAIHQDETEALKVADRIKGGLEDYPVVDEELWTEYEEEEARQVWRDCYRTKERVAYIRKHRGQFEFRDMSDMLGCVRGRYFAGYASELIS